MKESVGTSSKLHNQTPTRPHTARDHNHASYAYKLFLNSPTDFQKTSRIHEHNILSENKSLGKEQNDEQQESSEYESVEQDFESSLMQLTKEIQLQKQAIDRANQLISCLQQQNSKITKQFIDVVNLVGLMDGMICQLQERLKSSISHKQTYMAEVKVSNKLDFPLQSSLSIMHSTLLRKSLFGFQAYLKCFQNLIQQSKYQMPSITNNLSNARYLQNYLQDSLLDIDLIGFERMREMVDKYPKLVNLLGEYEQLIRGWENYAAVLKLGVIDCLCFIQSMGGDIETWKWNDKNNNNSQFKGIEIVQYVKKKICEIVIKKTEMKQVEIQELRQIIEALFSKISRKH